MLLQNMNSTGEFLCKYLYLLSLSSELAAALSN